MTGMNRRLRVLNRLLRLSAHILHGFVAILGYRLRFGASWYRSAFGQQRIQHWMRQLCGILGLRVQVDGRLSATPALLVANHISWLDIPALASITTGAFVAKSDVRGWPLLGALAGQSGTLFLARNSLAGMRQLMQGLTEVLQQGVTGVVFPEGTSTDGSEVQAFFPALFQAAIDAEVPIQAVAIRYYRAGQRDVIAPFIGDDSFFPHLLQILAQQETQVFVEFAQPLSANGCSRQLAARATHCWVERRVLGSKARQRRQSRRAA